MSILTHHPFKAGYVLAALCFEFARLPLYILKYVVPYGRPHPAWTYKQALTMRFVSFFVHCSATVQAKTPLPLLPGAEKDQFVTIDPAPSTAYKGPLAPTPSTKPVRIGGTWYPAPLHASTSDTEKNESTAVVVLHLHGGAYVTGDGRTQASGFFSKLQLKHGGATHVFCPQYRLSTLPASATSNAFPAALQDTLTAYLYLIRTLHIAPRNIILSGDSAGANAALALLRYIAEYGAEIQHNGVELPNPSAAWLWSPWLAPAESADPAWTRTNPHYATDYLSFVFSAWGANAYAGPGGLSVLDSPYVGFKGRPFRTIVPLWMSAGGVEVLYFDITQFAEDMRDKGNDVTLDVERHAPHDVGLVGNLCGFEREAVGMVKRAGEWYRGVRK
ncbi:alpha/beta-hydrolase [Lophiostoma macrostomum CBS 122681]|uniref:Alpha/beta-hydrolase n=1 Tax=Lophiostoma macrostomum CBS 122681 TaxID=1314788 RepID=A0A6A6SMH4_9PLEO|nr:alpha/beta-hydrolase [Lophiostoma macrostomum CBS 122681]